MTIHRLLGIAACLTLAQSLSAQETPRSDRLTVDRYLDWEGVSDPVLSSDAAEIVYVRRHVDAMNDEWESELWLMDADGSRQRFLVDGSSPRWSPSGDRLAYVARPEGSETTQLFVRWMADGATSQVTRVIETPSGLAWSPDGDRLAFVMFVPDEDDWDIDLPEAPEGATWTKAPRIIDRVHFRADRRGFLEDGTYQLFVVPATGGTPRRLTHGEGTVGGGGIGLPGPGSLDWTADGRTIVVEAVLDPEWESLYQESYIYAVDVETGQTRRLVDTKGAWGNPSVSPDGRLIALTGHPFADQTYHASELWVVGIDGAGMRRISGDLDRDPEDIEWAADGSGVYFTAEDRGTENVWFASLDGDVRQVTQGEHMLSLSDVAQNGLAVGTRTTPHEPGDVVRFSVVRFDGLTELTHVNDDVLAGVELGEVEELWYESSDGTRVQGWIVRPPDFDPAREYPLILHIHGGPHSMYDIGFSYSFQNYAANDYLVLYTNPRGSTGYGTAFGNAIDNAYPSVDYDDLMAGVDAAIARGSVDEDNMFVTGCSGGGVLSSWVIGHTDRFAAAGVRCPVINWMSFAGTADIVRWAYERFDGYPWTNPELYLEHSPLMYVGNVTTPTVIMTGELDLRTPMSQSEEYYQALKAVGVPTKLVRFREEYHGTGSKPSNFMRTQLYLMSWFEQWGGHDDVEVAGR
ncbi:MAG: prolyl oligopeptidase family serine peptidase [Longimicrobiales bacterium]